MAFFLYVFIIIYTPYLITKHNQRNEFLHLVDHFIESKDFQFQIYCYGVLVIFYVIQKETLVFGVAYIT